MSVPKEAPVGFGTGMAKRNRSLKIGKLNGAWRLRVEQKGSRDACREGRGCKLGRSRESGRSQCGSAPVGAVVGDFWLQVPKAPGQRLCCPF